MSTVVKLTVECPECDAEWIVTEDELKQESRGAATIIHCPECKRGFKVAGLKASGFVRSGDV